MDEWRKIQRRPERLDAFEVQEPVDPPLPGPDDTPFDADEFYALSVLHMTVGRVRKHLLEEGKAEHWMIFEELVLAPLIPGRAAKTREEILAMFPGQAPVVLDNRVTTVKRVFRRILPALVPTDPTENLTARGTVPGVAGDPPGLDELPALAGLPHRPGPGPGNGSPALPLTWPRGRSTCEEAEATVSPEILHDELRILLGFWLEMPLPDYLDDLEGVGPP